MARCVDHANRESADKPGSVASLRWRDSHSSRRTVARTL